MWKLNFVDNLDEWLSLESRLSEKKIFIKRAIKYIWSSLKYSNILELFILDLDIVLEVGQNKEEKL